MKKKVLGKSKKITKRPVRKTYPVITEYLRRVYSTTDYAKLINKMVLKIRPFCKKHQIEAIAFTGTSGAAVAYPISYKLQIPLVCIRKEKSHYGGLYEGRERVKRYIIVDDFIETGATIKRIKKQIKTNSPTAKLIGIFLYGGSSYAPYKEDDGIWRINV